MRLSPPLVVGVAVVASVVLCVVLCRPEGLRADAAGGLALAVLAAMAIAMAAPPRGRGARWLVICAGAACGALFLLSLPAWTTTVALVALGITAVAALPSFRGTPREASGIVRLASSFFVLAIAIALPVALVEIATGASHTFAMTLRNALPTDPWTWLASASLVVMTLVLVLDGARASRPEVRLVPVALVALTVLSLAIRLAWIASMTTLPLELYWFDAPFLANALKLYAHVPLYGPMADLNSFTYSPLTDLLHHALLRPIGLELSLHAHHALVLLDQAIAAVVLLWTVEPFARADRAPWARVFWVAAIVLAVFGNLLAPAVHPDHPLLVCMAIAFALVLAEERWPRGLWWTALVLVTPVAMSFKLSGAGIALGLAFVFALERRGRALAVVAVSGVLGLATVPFFGALLGDYATYAVTMHTGQDVEWGRIARLPWSPYVLGSVGALVFARFATGWRANRTSLLRVAWLTLGIVLVALRGYARPTARDNNLAPLLICTVLLVLLAMGDSARREPSSLHPALPVALVLLFTAAACRPVLPFWGDERAAVVRDSAVVTTAIRDATAAHHRVLPIFHTHAWIAAGRRDVLFDRYASALELLLAHRPEAYALAAHLEDGRYDTVIVAGRQLSPYPDARGDLNGRILAALASRYEVVYPAGVRDVTAVEGPVIYRLSR